MVKTGSKKGFLIYLKRQHNRNKNKGLYGYMGWSTFKIVLVYILIIVPIVLVAERLIDFNLLFDNIFKDHSTGFIIGVFFASESLLGLIPPDIFVFWSSKFNAPIIVLSLLGILSYIGGAISYMIGYWLATRPKIKAYSERVLDKYIILVRKWGGAFIIIAALFPFSPFSMVVIAVSLLKYPFRFYLLFGVARIARFLIQGVLYLDILKLDTFFGSIS